MKDFIVSLLVAFVLFRLVRGFFAEKQNTQRTSNNYRHEGQVDVNSATSTNKSNDHNKGEYIPYEEIK